MRAALALSALLLAACAPRGVLRVVTHPQIIEVKPSETYRLWWNQMRECAKDAKPTWPVYQFDGVKFFIVESDSTEGYVVEGPNGYSLAGGHINQARNSLTIEQRFMFVRAIVGHEMLHAQGHEHDPELWARCGVALYIPTR